jgi:hypothetical protein
MSDPWISVKEAAALMGYSVNYFRSLYCDPKAPLVTIRQRMGPKGVRRIMVLRVAVESVIESQTRRPA